MNMGVDESGHECAIAQIDDLGSRRMLDRWSGLYDAISLD